LRGQFELGVVTSNHVAGASPVTHKEYKVTKTKCCEDISNFLSTPLPPNLAAKSMEVAISNSIGCAQPIAKYLV
jgi:hypothetical protein